MIDLCLSFVADSKPVNLHFSQSLNEIFFALWSCDLVFPSPPVFLLNGGTSFMFPSRNLISGLQAFCSSSTLFCKPMELNPSALVQGCQSGISLRSLMLSVEQNG